MSRDAVGGEQVTWRERLAAGRRRAADFVRPGRRFARATPDHGDPLRFWRERAARTGTFAVLTQALGPASEGAIHAAQSKAFLAVLERELTGEEREVLDFGCGAGRFTGDLARLVGGTALGVDPTAELIDLARPAPGVRYELMAPARIPLADASVDVVWVCLVLGGVVDAAQLERTVAELERVLAPGGLLFLIENTTSQPDLWYWRYRSVESYRDLFPGVRLEHRGDYAEDEQVVSMIAGRKA
jgi:SAM-dependent methyltransferase